MSKTALIVVDMQKYYMTSESDFYRYAEDRMHGSMKYIKKRVDSYVIPNTRKLLEFFRANKLPVIYLKLCSKRKHRKDLHRFFYTEHLRAAGSGFLNLYPHISEPLGDIHEDISPIEGEKIFVKTTFSAFSSTSIKRYLKWNKISCCVFTGLATSQCVETTARDASDLGFSTIHIEDAQADYSHDSHYSSLFSSRSVCGSWIFKTAQFLENYDSIIESIINEERSLTF